MLDAIAAQYPTHRDELMAQFGVALVQHRLLARHRVRHVAHEPVQHVDIAQQIIQGNVHECIVPGPWYLAPMTLR